MWSTGQYLDLHWRPQYLICNPCYIKYHFIGRFENLKIDAKHVLDTLTATGSNATFPFLHYFDSSVPLSSRLNLFYSSVSRDIVRKLIHMYKWDYELFGYDYRRIYDMHQYARKK